MGSATTDRLRTAVAEVPRASAITELAGRETEFLVYQTKDSHTRVEDRFEGDTASLSLGQMAEIF